MSINEILLAKNIIWGLLGATVRATLCYVLSVLSMSYYETGAKKRKTHVKYWRRSWVYKESYRKKKKEEEETG